jgi:NAD(P)-dependent dehydrogenase (short-subunit alcohol dehydrogenase family)
MISRPSQNAFIAAISSDIGRALAHMYLEEGWNVIGTYRDDSGLESLRRQPRVQLIKCDICQRDELLNVAAELDRAGFRWDLFISAVGRLSPIGPFLNGDRDAWMESLSINGPSQLALLHAIAPCRRPAPLAKVAFLVGGAISRSFPNYSAYSLGKLQLVKFCELIHDEAPDMHAIAVGTGWVATKIHQQTLEAAALAGDNFERTRDFLVREEAGTAMADIKALLDWCFAQPRDITGGRNFSVVHDAWRHGGAALARALSRDADGFKLRRHGDGAMSATSSE